MIIEQMHTPVLVKGLHLVGTYMAQMKIGFIPRHLVITTTLTKLIVTRGLLNSAKTQMVMRAFYYTEGIVRRIQTGIIHKLQYQMCEPDLVTLLTNIGLRGGKYLLKNLLT